MRERGTRGVQSYQVHDVPLHQGEREDGQGGEREEVKDREGIQTHSARPEGRRLVVEVCCIRSRCLRSWSLIYALCSYRYQLEAFIDKVKGREPHAWVTAQDSVDNMEWVEKVYDKAS